VKKKPLPAWKDADIGERDGGVMCPSCGGGKTAVVDSRPASTGVRRRRCCRNCDARFTTFESTVTEMGDRIQITSFVVKISALSSEDRKLLGNIINRFSQLPEDKP